MAIFVPRFVRQLRDVLLTAPADGEVLTYDSADSKWKNEAGGGGGGPPTGAAGGVLGGTYPNPDFDVDMATQAELDAHVTDITDAHDATAVSVAPFGTIAATQVQAALEEIVAEAVSDLGPAVILAPASSARNVIQPTAADVRNLTLSPTAATTEALQVWLDQAGNPTAWMGSGEDDASLYAGVNTHFLLSRGGPGGFFDPNAGAAFTPGAAESVAGMWGDFEILPTADNSEYHYGIVGDQRLGITARPVGGIFGFLYDVWQRGTKASGSGAQITDLGGGGANAYTHSASTGDVTNIFGFVGSANHYGTGLVATLKGLRASAYVDPAAGVVTDAYGLHIEDVGHATKAVNAYGIRIATPLASSLAYAIKVDGGKSLFTSGLVIALIAAPADAAYANGEGGWWWDQANSLPKWKGKTSGGVVVNATPYTVGGTDVALADGGTGVSLVDPNADRIMFWDDSAGAVTWLTPGTNLTITGTTLDATAGGGGAPTDASYVTVSAEAGLSAETLYTALKLDDFAAPDDNTDLNVSTTKHGLTPKLSNVSTEYLSGTGVYSTPAAAGAEMIHHASGLWYAAPQLFGPALTVGGRALSGNRMHLVPFFVPVAISIDRIGISVNTGVVLSTVRLGIYNDTGSGKPGTLLLDAGTVATSSGNSEQAATVSQALAAGIYWFAVVSQTVASDANIFCANVSYSGVIPSTQQYYVSRQIAQYWYVSGVLAGLPSPAGTLLVDQNSTPSLGIRIV